VKLAIIPGDGIGPEVVTEAVKVLDAVLPGVEKTHYDLGAKRFHATGEVLPETTVAELREHDAILLGAIGDPSVPSGVLERGLLLRLRFELDHHVNLRPGRLYPGVSSPLAGNPDIDFVVIREGTEGPYTGTGGRHRGQHQHRVRGPPGRGRRLRACPAASQTPDAGAQDERADLRRVAVVADRG
jgi:3-isopropylmalate dehydrogenase